MPHYTIKRLMIAIGVVAGLLGLYRASGPLMLILVASLLSIGSAAWLGLRHHPYLAARVFAISAAITNGSVALASAYSYGTLAFILTIIASIPLIPLVFGSGLAWSWAQSRRMPKVGGFMLVLVLGLLPLSMMFTAWPLRVVFALSRSPMDRIADRIEAGETLNSPEWVGLYRIVDATRDTRTGNVALILDLDSAGRSGFVRVIDPSQSYGPMFNLNFDKPVGGAWRYQSED